MRALHDALLFTDAEEYVTDAVRYLREGLDAGQEVLAVAYGERVEALREALGHDADCVTLEESTRWYARPAAGNARLCAFARDHAVAGARVWAESPVSPTVGPKLIREYERLEATCQIMVDTVGMSLVCVFDRRRATAAFADAVARAHTSASSATRVRAAAQFRAPEVSLRAHLGAPLSEAPAPLAELRFPFDAAEVRRFVRDHAQRAGLSRDQINGLVVAVHEVAANALQYARSAEVCVWRERRGFVCEVTDAGIGIAEPLAGYVPPWHGLSAGRGLWLARQLVDLVELHSGPRGTAARLHVRLSQ